MNDPIPDTSRFCHQPPGALSSNHGNGIPNADSLPRVSFLPPLPTGRKTPGILIPSHLQLYAPEGIDLRVGPPAQPLRVVVLTSIRDVGVAEGVGAIRLRGSRPDYLRGTIETLFETMLDGPLKGYIDVVGIVTDDMPRDLNQHGYPVLPTTAQPWIFPTHLRNAEGVSVSVLTHNIPSTFRTLPLTDIEGRLRSKLEFETRLFNLMQTVKADVLLSDHFMAKIEFLFREDCFPLLHGRVLNTHCGPIRSDHPHPFRGRDPYRDALGYAGECYQLENMEGGGLPPLVFTGATLHFVEKEIDEGQVIAEIDGTPIFPDDTEDELMHRLYGTSKHPVVIAGLRHYVLNIFPHIAGRTSLDLGPIEPIPGLLP